MSERCDNEVTRFNSRYCISDFFDNSNRFMPALPLGFGRVRLCSVEDETLLAHLSGWCRARRKLARRLARQAEETAVADTSALGGTAVGVAAAPEARAAGDATAPETPAAENADAPAGSTATK